MKNKKETLVLEYHNHANNIAKHFGFEDLKQLFLNATTNKLSKKIIKENNYDHSLFSETLEERISLLQSYFNKELHEYNQPPLLSFTSLSNKDYFMIESINNNQSVSDAIIIETAYSIVKETYKKEDIRVCINCLNQKDNYGKFIKELQAHVKKNSQELKKDMPIIRKNILNVLKISNNIPHPISMASTEYRNHFSQVLEFLDPIGVPVDLNPSIIHHSTLTSGVMFSIFIIDKNGKDKLVAQGGRYNTLSKKSLGKKDLSCCGATILINKKTALALPKNKIIKEENIKFYFVQLGNTAKQKSLFVIDLLRNAQIPVHQSLTKDKISTQLAQAEKLSVPYILLIGHKEVIDNTITVRNTKNNSQSSIPVEDIINYLKNL